MQWSFKISLLPCHSVIVGTCLSSVQHMFCKALREKSKMKMRSHLLSGSFQLEEERNLSKNCCNEKSSVTRITGRAKYFGYRKKGRKNSSSKWLLRGQVHVIEYTLANLTRKEFLENQRRNHWRAKKTHVQSHAPEPGCLGCCCPCPCLK